MMQVEVVRPYKLERQWWHSMSEGFKALRDSVYSAREFRSSMSCWGLWRISYVNRNAERIDAAGRSPH
jgi:hypothetical protein